MDTIHIADLEVHTRIGVLNEERAEPQKLLVSVSMQCSCKTAGEADDVKQSIDYERVARMILSLAETERKTIECLAEDVASMILNNFKPESVEVTVKKFILPDTDHVSVTIIRP